VKSYKPRSLETASRDAPLPSLISVTVTPGTTPPESVTTPRTPPVKVWPHAVLVASGTNSSARKHHRETRFLILAFLQIEEICYPPRRAQIQRRRTDRSIQKQMRVVTPV